MKMGYFNFSAILVLFLVYTVFWVLGAIGTMHLAKNAGMKDTWLAWVPGLGQLLFVRLAGEKFRKLGIAYIFLITFGLLIPIVFLISFSFAAFTLRGSYGLFALRFLAIISLIFSPVVLSAMILRFSLLYEIFRRFKPKMAVVFLIFSILFRFLEPIFLIVTGLSKQSVAGEADTLNA